jgi:hypothetical protein
MLLEGEGSSVPTITPVPILGFPMGPARTA